MQEKAINKIDIKRKINERNRYVRYTVYVNNDSCNFHQKRAVEFLQN